VKRSLQSLIDGDLEGALDFIAERALLGKERRAYFEKQADPFDKDQLSNALSRGLIGAGVGAGLGGLRSMFQNKEHRRPLSSMLQGAALGGLGTAAGSFAYDNLNTMSPTNSPPVEAYNKQVNDEQTVGNQYQSGSGWSRPYAIGAGLGATGAIDTVGTMINRRTSNPKWLRAATKNMPEELAKLINSPSTTDADLANLHSPGPPSPTFAGRTNRTVRMPGPTIEPGGINHLVSELSKDPGGKPSLAVLEQSLAGDKAKGLSNDELTILKRYVERAKAGGGNPEEAFQTLLKNQGNMTLGNTGPQFTAFRNNLLEPNKYSTLRPEQQALLDEWRQHATGITTETNNRTTLAQELAALKAQPAPADPAAAAAHAQTIASKETALEAAANSLKTHEDALGTVMRSVGKPKKGGPVNSVMFNNQAGNKVDLSTAIWNELTGQRDPVTLSQEQLANMAHTPPGTKPVSPADVLTSLRNEKPSNMSAEQYAALLNDPAAESKLGLLMGAGGKQPVPQSFGGMEIPYETIQRYAAEGKRNSPGFGQGWGRLGGGPFLGAQTAGGWYMPRLPMYLAGGILGDKLLGQKELPPGFFESLQANHPDAYSQIIDAARKLQESRVAGDTAGAAAAQQKHEAIIQDFLKKYGQ
jgi:hypothetical protein